MTSLPPASTDADQQRCMLYLLDELSETDAAAFVRDLASSETLADLLGAEADLLASLNGSAMLSSMDSRSSTLVTPQTPGTATKPRHRQTVVFTLIALASAASIALFVFQPPSSTRPADAANESLLVAQAWAASNVGESAELDSVDESSPKSRSNRNSNASQLKANDAGEVEGDDEAIPSWMLVAFEIESAESTDTDQEPIDG